jgi:hypothetical protein
MLGQSGYSRAMLPNVREIERRLRSLEQQLERVGGRTSASTAEVAERAGAAIAPVLSSIADRFRGCAACPTRSSIGRLSHSQLQSVWVSLWAWPAVPLLQAPRERPGDRPAAERRHDLTASQSPLMLSVCRLERFARGKGTAFHSNR